MFNKKKKILAPLRSNEIENMNDPKSAPIDLSKFKIRNPLRSGFFDRILRSSDQIGLIRPVWQQIFG